MKTILFTKNPMFMQIQKAINPFPLKIFCGEKNQELSKEVVKLLKIKDGLAKRFYKEFPEGEILTHQAETVRDCDVVIIFQHTMNRNYLSVEMLEFLFLIRAIKCGSPWKIRVILPGMPYSRQDRGSKQREFSTFKLFCDLIYIAGADEIYTLSLHNKATTEFFSAPGSKAHMENVILDDFFIEHMTERLDLENCIIGAPDMGAGKSARGIAKRLRLDTVIIDKDRKPNDTESAPMAVIGDPSGKHVIFVDDMIAGGTTFKNAAQAVMEKGAIGVSCIASHLIASAKTLENLKAGNFREIWVSNTCPIPQEILALPNLKVFSVAKLIAQIIDNSHNGRSVSDLWNNGSH